MKIKVISDLHIDHNEDFKLETKFDDTFTIVAGDIAQVPEYKEKFLKQIKNGLWIAGNHDYWDQKDVDSGVKYFKKQYPKENSFSYLENDYKIINDIVFIGCTLWTDFNLYNDPGIAAFFTKDWPDFRYNNIIDSESNTIRLMNHNDMIKRFKESVAYIENTLEKFKDKHCVLIAHFVPITKGIAPKYKHLDTNAFFASNLDWLFDKYSNIKLLIFGHTHECFSGEIFNCKYICNPRGYLKHGEGQCFKPNLIVEVK